LKLLEDENARLKRLVADLKLDKHILSEVIRKSVKAVTPQGTRAVDPGALRGQPGQGVSAQRDQSSEVVPQEHGYLTSLRSLQRYWSRTYSAPANRARRRVETPTAAQVQADCAHFPSIVIGGERTELLALHMMLSHSRFKAIV
jgi:hypothetical protein